MGGTTWQVAKQSKVLGEARLIFVTVGFHYQGFERLVKAMDEISKELDEEVIIQIGHTKYEPKNASFFRFKERDQEIDALMRRARIIVCHSGVGTILRGLELGKRMVVMPRRKEYGEHVDDHQTEIAGRLSEEGLIQVANGTLELRNALLRMGSFRRDNSMRPSSDEKTRLLRSLSRYIQLLSP